MSIRQQFGMEDALQSAAEEVFNGLGAGFTESVYHRAMHVELSSRGIMFSSEGSIPVFYRGAPVGRRHPDLFLFPEDGKTVVVELKAGSKSGKSQLLQYLDMTQKDSNFNDIIGGAVIRFNDVLEFEYINLSSEEDDN